MNDPHIISYIADEMLADPEMDAQFVINVSKLAQEDAQMFKYMQLWMTVADYDIQGLHEVEDSMKDYMRRKALYVRSER